ncbi:MAG: glutamine--fructose-6-phosphate transaminase (isomerizing) [Clostridia bacterium]|nr:glutamine--fructose-6-phosphate transaminase (isomerizing) [Clostridia bacterium]
MKLDDKALKEKYDHFMLKEILEQPAVLRDTIDDRIRPGVGGKSIDLGEMNLDAEWLAQVHNIYIAACGTSYHAGLVGKYAIEGLTGIHVEVDLASEFRYRNPLLGDKTLVVVISQSGETADTLEAMRMAKEKGARILAVVNVEDSTIPQEAHHVLYTRAGVEVAVASTKAYVTQLAAMYLIAGYFAQQLNTIPRGEIDAIASALKEIPEKTEEAMGLSWSMRGLAPSLASKSSCFYTGRCLDYPVAMEGSLKLKEITYIHATPYAAGELKHGTLALIEEGVPVVAVATQEHVYDRMYGNLQELIDRGAYTIGVTCEGNNALGEIVDRAVHVPKTLLSPIVSVIPLQFLAYYTAVEKGTNIDKPRNLTKSVRHE